MNIQIENFRRIRYAQIITRKPVNLLVGANGAGKTSVLEAIRWAILGSECKPEGPGLTFRDFATHGAKATEMSIGLTVAGQQIEMTRRFTASQHKATITIDGEDRGSSIGDVEAALYGIMGGQVDRVKALLDGRAWFTMTPVEQRKALARLSGCDWDVVVLREKLLEKHHSTSAVIRNFDKISAELAGLTGVELVEKAIEAASTCRTLAHRDVESERTRLVSERERLEQLAEQCGALPDGSATETSLRDKLASLEKQAGDNARARETRARLEQQVTMLEGELARRNIEKAALTDLEDALKVIDDGLEVARERVSSLNEDIAKADAAERDYKGPAMERFARFAAANSKVGDLVSLLEAGCACCPTCQQEINRAQVETIVAQLSAEADALRKQVQEDEKRQNEFAKARIETEQALKTARDAVASLEENRKRTVSKHEAADRAIEYERHRLDEARKALAEAPETTEAEDLSAQIATIANQLAYVQQKTRVDNIDGNLVANQLIHAGWNNLVDALRDPHGPGGEMAKDVDDMLESVSEILRPWGEYISHGDADEAPLMIVGLGNPDNRLPALPGYLSGAEKMLLSAGIQFAFCRALQFPLILMDMEASLDPRNRERILQWSEWVAGEYPEAVVLATMTPSRTEWSPMITDLVDTWQVSRGVVELTQDGQTYTM